MEEELKNNNSKPTNQKGKQEPTEKVKRRKAKIAVVTLCTIVVLLLGLQVYASTNGYGNIFFMIRNLITTGNPAGVQEIFSDKDITLSYKSIDLAEGLKIQANRLEIKDKETKIYLTVKGQKNDYLPLKYEITTKSNEGTETTNITKITGNKPENKESFSYEEILTLNYAVDENKTIILKISDSSEKELKTLEINLQTREITVKGEKAFEKISEVELKKYLNLFSELNNESGKENVLLYIAQSLQDNYKEFMKEEDYQYRMDKSTDRAYKNAIIKEFYGENAKFEYVNQKDTSKPKVEVLKGITAWQYNKENDSYQPITAGEEYRHGKCLKIEDISFENDIYTVKYIYLLATGIDEDADRLEELPQYETTIKLKRDEDNLYSKYQIVSLENGVSVKDKVSTNIEENNKKETNTTTNTINNTTNTSSNMTNTTNETTNTNNSSNNNQSDATEKIDNYATSISWTEHNAPGLKLQYPSDFTLTVQEGAWIGNRQGELSTTIKGVAKGIDKQTNEIIESDMEIYIYEPIYAPGSNRDEFFTQKTGHRPGVGYEVSSGTWWEASDKVGNKIMETFTTYHDNWGQILKINYTNTEKPNYKVTNIINWIMGSLKITSY